MTSPREDAAKSSDFFPTIEGDMTNMVNGVTNNNGNKTPIKINEQKMCIITNVAGRKLLEKSPDIPMKAASHGIFGNVGWCPDP